MSFNANMELWTEMSNRLQGLRAALLNKARTDDNNVKREVAKSLYNNGYLTTQLEYSCPTPEQPADAQADELAALQHEVDMHEATSIAI